MFNVSRNVKTILNNIARQNYIKVSDNYYQQPKKGGDSKKKQKNKKQIIMNKK